MAFDIDDAFTLDESGVSFTNTDTDIIANISAGADDPSVVGITAPIGSLYMNTTTGVLYTKINALDTDWRPVSFGGNLLGLGLWDYDTSTTPPPSNGGFRFNNALIGSATKLYLEYDNDDGDDLTTFIQAITVGSILYIQERDNSDNRVVVRVSANTNQGTYAEFDIDLIKLFGTLNNNDKCILVVSYAGTGSGDFFNPAYVRVATIGNINLAAPGASIDGTALSVGDRVLVWQQTTPSENGVWIWNGAATPMTRPSDMDTWEKARGRRIYVIDGTQYQRSTWENNSDYIGTIGVTSMTWTGSTRRISDGGRFDLGDSWTSTRANSAFGPRVLSLIDSAAVVRVWRFTSSGATPGLEFIYGTNDDAGDPSNDWWDITLNESPDAGIRIADRTGFVTSIKLFASDTGVRIGPSVSETNPAVALSIDSTDAVLVPVGTTAQRPTGVNGYLRYNTSLDIFEGYEAGSWDRIITRPAGSNTEVQFNNSGAFGADANFTYDTSIDQLNLSGTGTNLVVGSIVSLPTAKVVISTDSTTQEALRLRWDPVDLGIGSVTFDYNLVGVNGPSLRFFDNDDPSHIVWDIGGTIASPTNRTRLSSRGGLGTATTGLVINVNGTNAWEVDTYWERTPSGTTAQRPGTAVDGMMRYNTDTEKFEGYEDGAWVDFTTAYGTFFQYAASEAISSTTSTTFQNKVSLTTPSLPSGDYRIGWYFEWRHTSTGTDFRARVQINNTTDVMEQQEEPQDGGSDQWRPTGGFVVETLSGANTIDLDWSRVGSSGTSSIRRARLEIWRVS